MNTSNKKTLLTRISKRSELLPDLKGKLFCGRPLCVDGRCGQSI